MTIAVSSFVVELVFMLMTVPSGTWWWEHQFTTDNLPDGSEIVDADDCAVCELKDHAWNARVVAPRP